MAAVEGPSQNKRRSFFLIVLVLLGVMFLLGFVPQWMRANALEQELSAAREQMTKLTAGQRFARVRDLAALMHLETARQNFGLAGQRASEFFSEARTVAGQTNDQGLQQALEQALRERDAITAGLAKAEPTVQPKIEQVLEGLQAYKQ